MSGEIPEGAGGASNRLTFLFNSGYSIKFDSVPEQSVPFFVEVVSPNTQMPISLYYIPTKGNTLFDLSRQELVGANANFAFLKEVNSVFAKITANRYFIVPTTITPTLSAEPYELRV